MGRAAAVVFSVVIALAAAITVPGAAAGTSSCTTSKVLVTKAHWTQKRVKGHVVRTWHKAVYETTTHCTPAPPPPPPPWWPAGYTLWTGGGNTAPPPSGTNTNLKAGQGLVAFEPGSCT